MIGTPVRPRPRVQAGRKTSHVAQLSLACFDSDLGWMAIAWGEKLHGLSFGCRSKRDAELALATNLEPLGLSPVPADANDLGRDEKWVANLIDRLRQFAQGEPAVFADVPLALDHLTPFGRRVVEACRRIPWGRTRSYGELAAACGSPGAARAVGTVMAKNRYPLIVPCHRVVGAGGGLGGYSAPDGLRMKRRLLAMESASHK